MSSDTIVEVIKVLPTYLQAIAVIAGGVWGYRKFIHQRANEPATDIDIDLKFVGIQDDEWIIEITSFLSNKSLGSRRISGFPGDRQIHSSRR